MFRVNHDKSSKEKPQKNLKIDQGSVKERQRTGAKDEINKYEVLCTENNECVWRGFCCQSLSILYTIPIFISNSATCIYLGGLMHGHAVASSVSLPNAGDGFDAVAGRMKRNDVS